MERLAYLAAQIGGVKPPRHRLKLRQYMLGEDQCHAAQRSPFNVAPFPNEIEEPHSWRKPTTHFEGSGMDRRSGRLKTPSNLFDHRLNAYVLSASAAGVAMLGCSLPADAVPVCRELTVRLLADETYAFNPAAQQIAPFNIAQTFLDASSLSQAFWNRAFFTPNFPGAEVLLGINEFPAGLPAGAVIGPGGDQFGKGQSYGLLFTYGPSGGGTVRHHQGNIQFGQINYIGFRFLIRGKNHYGWLRLKVTFYKGAYQTKETATRILAYGYETTPDVGISAGSCLAPEASIEPGLASRPRGHKAASGNAASDRTSFAIPPISHTPQPASLGLLALGASGIPLWRRK